MRVILEGPDNAGKTTLARHLMEAGCNYFHPGGSPGPWEAELKCIDQQLAILALDPKMCMDRITPISQEVYATNMDLAVSRRRSFDLYMRYDPVLIYCRPSTDRLLRSDQFTWRDDEPEEHKKKIIDNAHLYVRKYDDVMAGLPCIHYDFEATDDAELLRTYLRRAVREGPEGAARQFLRTLTRR